MSAGANILVVDDDKSIRLVVSRLLLSEGHTVRTANNGLEALTSIDIDPPDLAIVDIGLPELNGLDLVKGLRNHPETHDLPVIFLTASDNLRDFTTSTKLKARYFITKPFSNDNLVEKVTIALKGKGRS